MAGIIFSIYLLNEYMRRVLFIVAALTAVAWMIGFFILKAGMFIHVSMMTSALCWMQAIIINPKPQVIR